MSNDSTAPGYLTPLSEPLTRQMVEDALHDAVAGITGMDPRLVRPRWQSEPPKQPGHDVTWCSVGVLSWSRDGYPAVEHSGDEGGTDAVLSWKTLSAVASFYGPAADDLADRLMDGLAVEQNRTDLRAAGIALTAVGDPVDAPELINNRWVRRVDLPLSLQMETRRVYGVRNILCGPVMIESDTGLIVQTAPMMEEN